jgi:predicted RNase H-like nuclease
MDRSRFTLALPDDPDLIGRLVTALAVQSDPPIAATKSGQVVIAFESATAELMLRSRVMQALEVAVGPDWQTGARTVS